MEKAIEQLKSEGYTSDEIKAALLKMKEETMEEPVISGSLDDYLDSVLYEEDVLAVENGQSVSYEIDSAEDIFNKIKKD